MKTQPRRGNNSRGGRLNQGRDSQDNYVAPLRTTQLGFPDRMATTLSFFSAPSFAPVVGASAYAYRYAPSNAFDVDPLLGGVTMPGFDEFANVYASYRVLGSRIKVKCTGIGTAGATIMVLPLNADPGAVVSAATIISWRGQPYCKSKLAGATGSPAIEINNEMTTAKIYASDMVLSDDNFAALVTTAPVNNWYWAVGLYQNFVFATQPVVTDVQILVDVQFYDRKYLVT
jgi:hypothetical protein